MRHHARPLSTASFATVLMGVLLCLGWLADASASETQKPGGIDWQPYSKEVFERAKAEKRFIIMDVEAIWCHWCHVMEAETYSDPKVIAEIKKSYIAVRVDQDSRPDVSIRYEEYGWPATVIFGPDGTEIMKRRGFIPANIMLAALEEVVKDPTPVPGIEVVLPETYHDGVGLDAKARESIQKRHVELLDHKLGGLDGLYRFLPYDNTEHAMHLASRGDQLQATWLRKTLDASYAMIDPAFGGVYQYSVNEDWKEPHHEKIMQFQSETLRFYALAYAELERPSDLDAARNVMRFTSEFLTSPEGAFYTSQDADLVKGQKSGDYFALSREERLKRGVPRVDKNRYARENGWMIESLATFYEATGDADALERALRAARWVLANRKLEGGGFRHDAVDKAGPYLGDTLAMGRGCLALYRATAGREWLTCARDAAGFIEATFKQEKAGYLSAKPAGGPAVPVPQFDEQVKVARFANLLAHYSGDEKLREISVHALRFLGTPKIYEPRRETAGALLADRELASDPLHLTIVGSKKDELAAKLYAAALRQGGGWYKRVEWWDKAEGALPNPDVQYPNRPGSAAYVCSSNSCSAPIIEPAGIAKYLARRDAPKKQAQR